MKQNSETVKVEIPLSLKKKIEKLAAESGKTFEEMLSFLLQR